MPRYISSKYSQYKHDTLQLSTWLAQAALNYGFGIDILSPSPTPLQEEGERRTAAQLRNARKKANRRARENGEVKPESQAEQTQQTVVSGDYVLKIPQFSLIAKFLVEQEITIPRELRKLLRRCIDMRFDCLRRFLPRPDASTASHRHFINVLQEVEQIFEAYSPTNLPKAAKTRHGASVNSNLYNKLPSEEEDEEEDGPDIILPEPPKPSQASFNTARLVVAPEGSREEAVYSILTFLEDVQRIRTYLIGTWVEYREGDIDLITASVTTNTALELLRRSHDDLLQNIYPLFSLNVGLMEAVLVTLLSNGEAQAYNSPMPLFTQIRENDETMKKLYDFLLIPVLQLVSGMADVIVDGSVPAYKPGYFGVWDPDSRTKSLGFQEYWQQAKCLLCESWLQYLLANFAGRKLLKPTADGKSNIFFMDEMAFEMDIFSKIKQPTFLLMAHAQIYVDINFTLGRDNKRGRKDMRDGLTAMAKTLAKRSEIEGRVAPPGWPAESERAATILREEMDTWKTLDPIDMCMRSSIDKAPSHSKNAFLERAPMLCGLILFRNKLHYQKVGLGLANAWGSILSTAHLLTACRHYDTVDGVPKVKSWPDMDLVMDLHGKEDLFGGKMPETVDDSLYSFLIMMGYSHDAASAFKYSGDALELHKYIHDRRAPIAMEAKDGPQGMQDHTQIVPIFYRRYAGDFAFGTRLELDLIESLLVDVQKDTSKRKRKRKLRKERSHKTQKLSLVQLLSIIEAGLITETTSVQFDYVGMHLRCLQLLKRVQKGAHNYLVGKAGERYIENDSQLPFIAGWIIKIAALSGKAAEQLGLIRPGKHGVVISSKLLVGAVQSMNEYLSEPGVSKIEVERIQR